MFSFVAGRRTVGTFVKTDSAQIVEILAHCGLDYAVLDAEHAPYDLALLDRMSMAARGSGLPLLVRVPDHADSTILRVLDLGAAGIVVPHVDSPDDARAAIAAARYVGGRRGISLSTRSGGYGTRALAEVIAEADRLPIVCQIESAAAVEAVEAIAAVPDIGALFVGRLDLALSLGVSGVGHPAVMAALARVTAAARPHGLPVVVACAEADIAELAALGADSFLVGTDQSLLMAAASRLRGAVNAVGT